MNQPRFLLKLSAIISSVSLVAALIAYQSGAFDRLKRQNERSTQPATSQQPTTDSTQSDPTLMPGSKSFIMSSSKSIILAESTYTADIGPYVPPQPTADPKPPVIMGGSKSLGRPIIRVPVMPLAEPETTPSK